jgi:hypothetical protein
MVYQEAEDIRDLKVKTREAIAFAMDRKWEEAIALNRELIDLAPDNSDAYNRLGKALLETGDADAARAAFKHSLALDSSNTIARKNLDRLANGTASTGGSTLSHKMFISDPGKSAQVSLIACATDTNGPYIAPGAAIELRVSGANLAVYNDAGHYVGIVPPQLGHRLRRMMEAGNRYGGAIVGSNGQSVRVLLHERYVDPSQRSKISFPASAVVDAEPTEQVAAPVAEESTEEMVDLSILEDDGAATDEAGEHVAPDEVVVEGDVEDAVVNGVVAEEDEELEEAI